MLECLKENKFGEFEKVILEELEGHNKLEEFQNKEKDLNNRLKKLKNEI